MPDNVPNFTPQTAPDVPALPVDATGPVDLVDVFESIAERIRVLTYPQPPTRDVIIATYDAGATETLTPGIPFESLTINNTGAFTVYVAGAPGIAREAAVAGRVLPGAFAVPAGRIYTFPLRGYEGNLAVAGAAGGGTGNVEVYRWTTVQPLRADIPNGVTVTLTAGAAAIGSVIVSALPALVAGAALIGRVNPEPQTANGLTIFRLLSAATTNATNIKAAAGQVYTIVATNVNAAARFVKLYNKATAPVVGTDTPVMTLLIPGNAAGAVLYLDAGGMGLAFPLGIGLAVTALVADADVTAVALNEVIVNMGFK